MALPKFDKETFRSAALGLGALAMVSTVSLGLPTSQAHAQDARPVAAATTAASYAELGLPAAQAPTAERPYHYMNFDEQTKAQYPSASPIDALPLNGDKLVVLNFTDESSQYSAMQTQVLKQTLAALSARSQNKELMLVDVATRDTKGNDLYMSEYMAFYDENSLGPNGTTLQSAQLPYGLAYGDPVNENGEYGRLFDFALLNGVKNDADLNANAEGIFGKLNVVVNAYNQKKVAAPSPE